MRSNKFLIVIFLVIELFSYEKKLIDIGYLEKETIVEDYQIPKNKTPNLSIHAEDKESKIYINDEYYGKGFVKLSLDTGTHKIHTRIKDSITFDTIVNTGQLSSFRINLGKMRKIGEITNFVGINSVVRSDKSDIIFPVIGLSLGFTAKEKWTHSLIGSTNPFEYNSSVPSYDKKDLDEPLDEDGFKSNIYFSGYYSFTRNYKVNELFEVRVGGRIGLGLGAMSEYFDTVGMAKFYYRDENGQRESFYTLAKARGRWSTTYFDLGGPTLSLMLGKKKCNVLLKGTLSVGRTGKGAYFYDEAPLDDSYDYDYGYMTGDYDESFVSAVNGNASIDFLFQF